MRHLCRPFSQHASVSSAALHIMRFSFFVALKEQWSQNKCFLSDHNPVPTETDQLSHYQVQLILILIRDIVKQQSSKSSIQSNVWFGEKHHAFTVSYHPDHWTLAGGSDITFRCAGPLTRLFFFFSFLYGWGQFIWTVQPAFSPSFLEHSYCYILIRLWRKSCELLAHVWG